MLPAIAAAIGIGAMLRHMQRRLVGNQRESFLDRLSRRLQGFMGKRNLDVVPALQALGHDIRHFVVAAREWAEGFEQHHALDPFRKRAGVEQTHAAAQRVADDRHRIFVQVLQQSGEIGEKVFMGVAAAGARPLAVAMAAQVERHRMLDRHAAADQLVKKMIPTAPLIAHAVDEDVSLLLGIAPFPIMQFQTVVNEVTPLRLPTRRGFGSAKFRLGVRLTFRRANFGTFSFFRGCLSRLSS